MLLQTLADSLDARDHAGFKLSLRKSGFHFSADAFPFLGLDSNVDPAIGNDFNVTVGEEQVNSTPLLCSVSQTRSWENTSTARSRRRLIFKQRQRIQCRLYRETNFPLMADFRFFDRLFDSRQGSNREMCAVPARWPVKKWPQYPSEIHSPSPRCTAAAKPAATPAETTAPPEATATSATKSAAPVPATRASS